MILKCPRGFRGKVMQRLIKRIYRRGLLCNALGMQSHCEMSIRKNFVVLNQQLNTVSIKFPSGTDSAIFNAAITLRSIVEGAGLNIVSEEWTTPKTRVVYTFSDKVRTLQIGGVSVPLHHDSERQKINSIMTVGLIC